MTTLDDRIAALEAEVAKIIHDDTLLPEAMALLRETKAERDAIKELLWRETFRRCLLEIIKDSKLAKMDAEATDYLPDEDPEDIASEDAEELLKP